MHEQPAPSLDVAKPFNILGTDGSTVEEVVDTVMVEVIVDVELKVVDAVVVKTVLEVFDAVAFDVRQEVGDVGLEELV